MRTQKSGETLIQNQEKETVGSPPRKSGPNCPHLFVTFSLTEIVYKHLLRENVVMRNIVFESKHFIFSDAYSLTQIFLYRRKTRVFMKRSTIRLMYGLYVVLGLVIIALALFAFHQNNTITSFNTAYRAQQSLSGIGDYDSTHEHADMAMYINGVKIDFTKEEYQEKHPLVHLEAPERGPGVIHKHATGITYGMFFETIGIDLGDCLVINEKEFCDGNGRSLKYYVNGRIVPNLASLDIHDLDKVLISYGSESTSEIQTQLTSIGNHACEQSGKC